MCESRSYEQQTLSNVNRNNNRHERLQDKKTIKANTLVNSGIARIWGSSLYKESLELKQTNKQTNSSTHLGPSRDDIGVDGGLLFGSLGQDGLAYGVLVIPAKSKKRKSKNRKKEKNKNRNLRSDSHSLRLHHE